MEFSLHGVESETHAQVKPAKKSINRQQGRGIFPPNFKNPDRLLELESLADVIKDLERPDHNGNPDKEWKKKVGEWWKSLTPKQQQRFKNAFVRENEIAGLSRDLQGKEAVEKRKRDLKESKTADELDLKVHCAEFPVTEDEF